MSLWSTLVAPFSEYAFMRSALVACMALAVASGPLGTLLLLRRMGLVGDVLSHAVMPGAAIAFALAGSALAVLSTVPAGIDPEGLTLNRAGTALYVVNENELSVTVLDAASLTIRAKIAVGKEPETAVASPDGRWIAVSNETSDDVHVIATAGDTVVKQIPVPRTRAACASRPTRAGSSSPAPAVAPSTSC